MHCCDIRGLQAVCFVNWIGCVWQAGSLSLPCREMCEAVVSTCSCGRERTLGSLLSGIVSGLLVSLFACPLAAGDAHHIVLQLRLLRHQYSTAVASRVMLAPSLAPLTLHIQAVLRRQV